MKDKNCLIDFVTKAQAGDQDAMNDLISACYEDLYYFAYQTTKDPDTAADVTQEACIKIVTNLGKLQAPEAFRVWARNITYNQCAQYFRQVKDLQPLETEDGESILDSLPDESEGSLPEQIVEDKEFQKTMQDMLDSLPAQQRSAMLLYYYEKMSVKQIADIFETSEGTIKSRLNYGRKAMKDKVEEYEKKNNVRLHSSLLPLLLLWLFGAGKKSMPKAAPALVEITGTVAQGVAGASGTAATGLGLKIAAAVVAGVLVVGAAVGGVALLGGAAVLGGVLLQQENPGETPNEEPPVIQENNGDIQPFVGEWRTLSDGGIDTIIVSPDMTVSYNGQTVSVQQVGPGEFALERPIEAVILGATLSTDRICFGVNHIGLYTMWLSYQRDVYIGYSIGYFRCEDYQIVEINSENYRDYVGLTFASECERAALADEYVADSKIKVDVRCDYIYDLEVTYNCAKIYRPVTFEKNRRPSLGQITDTVTGIETVKAERAFSSDPGYAHQRYITLAKEVFSTWPDNYTVDNVCFIQSEGVISVSGKAFVAKKLPADDPSHVHFYDSETCVDEAGNSWTECECGEKSFVKPAEEA